jgi:glycosyltransferase involved in cell wall biosynthesis
MNRKQWRARYYLGALPFRLRSATASKRLADIASSVDAVLMYGNDCQPVRLPETPLFVYSDNFSLHTAQVSHSNMAQLNEVRQRIAHSNEVSVFNRASGIFTFSDYIARQLEIMASQPKDKLETVYAGFSLDPRISMLQRDEVAFHSPPRILFVAREWKYKGGDLLLLAFETLRKTYPDATLTIAGFDAPPPHVKSVPRGVKFAGYLSKRTPEGLERLTKLYQESTMFVLPTLYDSFPIVLLEAMSSGLPIITSRLWALPEMVPEGVAGFTVPPGDFEGVAAAMLRLASNPEIARALGEAGRERACRLFSWDAVAARMEHRIRRELLLRVSTDSERSHRLA